MTDTTDEFGRGSLREPEADASVPPDASAASPRPTICVRADHTLMPRALDMWRSLLSALAPSWQLFDDVGRTPVLQIRSEAPTDGPSPWQTAPIMAPARTPRSAWRILHNPEETLRLAACSLVDRLVAEVNDAVGDADIGALRQGATYQMVLRLVRREALALGCTGDVAFRIILVAVEKDADDMLVLESTCGPSDG